LFLAAGCETYKDFSLTHKLWTDEARCRHAEPAPQPRLALSEGRLTNEIVVQYDEVQEMKTQVQRRAYSLAPNLVCVAENRKPVFLDARDVVGLRPIPRVDSSEAATRAPAPPVCFLVPSSESREFILFRNTVMEGPYELPVYAESQGTALKVALTPFAVTADTVVVGVVASVAAAFLWVFVGAPGASTL
jgi:hypothetical protein